MIYKLKIAETPNTTTDKTGLSNVSLMCQTSLMDKDAQPLIREILDELKAV
jgi:hypothetical protein